MADPLSIAASIAGLVGLTLQVVDINKRYLDSVRNAPRAIKAYQREVVTLQAAINALQDRLKDPELRAHLADCQKSSPDLLKIASVGITQCSADLQRICDKVAKKDNQLPLLTRLTWFFNEGEIEDAILRVQRYRSMIIDDFNNALAVIVVIDTKNLLLSAAEVERLGGEALDRLDRINGRITSISDTSLKTLGTVQDIGKDLSLLNVYQDVAFQTEVLDWLSKCDPSSNHNVARKAHQTRTGSWFLESDDYNSWYRDPDLLMWLHGLPGSGKTVLCSTIIEDIKQRNETSGDARCAYFYFDFRDRSKQTVDGMLRSLLRQLASFQGCLPRSIADLHRAHARQGHQPSQEALVDTLYSIAEHTSGTSIVIDALDECVELDEALDLLLEIIDNSRTKLSVLVTSRELDNIGEAIKDVSPDKIKHMSIQNRKDNADIDAFIRVQVEKNRKLRRWRNHKPQIVRTLSEGARGMFRWVVCQLESLSTCTSVEELDRSLKSLPPTLPATYERILTQIPETYREKVHVLLQWLTFQNGDWTWSGSAGLTLARAAEAAVVMLDSPFDPGARLPYSRDILGFASSLVTLVDRQTAMTVRIVITTPEWADDDDPEMLQLAHASVKDYLTSHTIRSSEAKGFYISETDAHVTLAGACLRYLLSMDNEALTDNAREWPKQYPLLEYAAHNWNYHFRQVPETHSRAQLLVDLACKLLDGSSSATSPLPLQNWLLVLSKRGSAIVEQPSLMHYAVLLDLPNLLRSLLVMGLNTNLENENSDPNGALLRISEARGHDEISSILVRHKYNVSTASKKTHDIPLLLAILDNKPDLVELLLNQGAADDLIFIHSKTNTSRNHLNVTVRLDDNGPTESGTKEASHLEFTRQQIQYLIDHANKATVRFSGYTSKFRQIHFIGTLLHWVILTQDEVNFKLLLRNGAEVDLSFRENGKGKSIDGTALFLALQGKSEVMQNELLDRDTDPNAAVITRWDSEFHIGTVFHIAVRLGKIHIIQRLLDKGANIEYFYEAKEDSFTTSTTALSIAIAYNHPATVEFLLDHGASPRSLTSTSMIVDAERHESLPLTSPRYLLEFRISILGQDISSLPHSTLQKILDKGGLVNCEEEDVVPPMIAHITRMRIETVQFLLSSGADVHHDGKFGTPLYHAAHLYDRTIENMLRERGALDVSTVPYWTGL